MDNLLPEEVASSLGNLNLKQDLASILARFGVQIGGVFVPGQSQAVKKDFVYVVGLQWWRALKDMTASAQPVNGANWSLFYNGQQLTDEQLTYVRALLSPLMVTTGSRERIGFNTLAELTAYKDAAEEYTIADVDLHELIHDQDAPTLDWRYINVYGNGRTLNAGGASIIINQEADNIRFNGFGELTLSGRFFRVFNSQPSRVPAGDILNLRYCEFSREVVVSTGATLRLYPGTEIDLDLVTLEGAGKIEDLRGAGASTSYTDDQARAANAERFEQNEAILDDHEERITQLEQATAPTASVLPFGPFLATGDPAQQFGPLPLVAQSLRAVNVLNAELDQNGDPVVEPIFSTMYTLSSDGLYFTMKTGNVLDAGDLIEGLCSGVASSGGGTTPGAESVIIIDVQGDDAVSFQGVTAL